MMTMVQKLACRVAVALHVATFTLLCSGAEGQFLPSQAGLEAGQERTLVIGRNDAVLFFYICADPQCDPSVTPPQEAMPQVTVVDDSGAEISGSASLLVAASFPASFMGRGYLRWTPAHPFSDGRYQARLQPVFSGVTSDVAFTVLGESGDDPPFEVNWALRQVETQPAGTLVHCPNLVCLGACSALNWSTQRLAQAMVKISWPVLPPANLTNSYLIRAVDPGEGDSSATAWHSVNIDNILLIDAERPEYCAELQSLRVRDQHVSSVSTMCLVGDVGSLGPAPTEFDESCRLDGDHEEYSRAWCRDNAPLCSQGHEDAHAACQTYSAQCGPLSAGPEADGSSASPKAAGCSVRGAARPGNSTVALFALVWMLLLRPRCASRRMQGRRWRGVSRD